MTAIQACVISPPNTLPRARATMGRLQGGYSEVHDKSLDTDEGRYEGKGFGYHSQYHYAPNPPDSGHDYETKSLPKSSKRQYKPTALGWPFLLTLLSGLLISLAFLSYAVTSLPSVGSRDSSERVAARGLYRSMLIHTPTTEYNAQTGNARNVGAREADSDTPALTLITTPSDVGTITIIGSDSSTPTTAGGSDDFDDAGTITIIGSDTSTPTTTGVSDDSDDSGTITIIGSDTSTPTTAGGSDDFGDTGTITIIGSDSATPTSAADSDDSDDAGDQTIIISNPPPSDFGQIGTKTVIESDSSTPAPAPTATGDSDDSGDMGTQTLIISNPPPSDFGQIGTKTITESDVFTPAPTAAAASNDSGDADDAGDQTIIISNPAPSDFGQIGTKTITDSDPSATTEAGVSNDPSDDTETPTFVSNPAQGDYGRIGTQTVTGALPDATIATNIIGTAAGGETATQPESNFGEVGSRTINDQHPGSTTQIEIVMQVTLGVTTITDKNGSPIATSTRTLNPLSSLQTRTLTNSEGQATATQVATVMITPSTSVETDSAGNPTATVAVVSYPAPPSVHTAVYSIDSGHYFMGTFLPTLVASILAIAVRILDVNAKSFQPWHALTHDGGASGRDSLCLQTGGWRSLAMGLRSLAGGHTVVFLASLLSLLSALLVPVAAGAITLDLRGDGCKIGGSSASNCAYVLSVSPMVSKAAIGILAAMSLTTILLGIMVGRWRLGVYTNPWSMCTLASLSANPDVRRLVLDAATGPDKKQAKSQLKHQDFKLDYYRGAKGQMEYGIVALDRFRGTGLSSFYEKVPHTSRLDGSETSKRIHGPPFFMLGNIGRLCLIFVLDGVLVLVLYYARTGGDTAFERFIDSDSFGVQFLFTGLGVLISLFWSAFLGAVSVMNSYQVLAKRPQEASQSVLLAPPTNAFSALWHAVRTRRVFLGLVSLASILSESLGTFLGNVRFQVTQTYFVSQLSTWTAVGIMSFMVLILLSSLFLKWPDMPVEPSSIAGAMYYVCDTSVVEKFEGLSMLDKKERDRAVTDMTLMYEFSERASAAGETRIGLKTLDS
ncbi:hypothetical protein F5Y12DRAFT_799419 [Xylaria sp. FL1777]|nr:hypothetical protein F5Y12DRAFT_799419 [Xylaria sp. FL1777]